MPRLYALCISHFLYCIRTAQHLFYLFMFVLFCLVPITGERKRNFFFIYIKYLFILPYSMSVSFVCVFYKDFKKNKITRTCSLIRKNIWIYSVSAKKYVFNQVFFFIFGHVTYHHYHCVQITKTKQCIQIFLKLFSSKTPNHPCLKI